MAVDRVLLRRVEAGLSGPVLRVYSWDPHCISLGYSQKPLDELELNILASRGWDWVMRPTGGRAVLHAREFTYSLIAPVNWAPWCATRDASYAAIGKALCRLLQEAGIHGELARGDSLEGRMASVRARPCFASTSRLEVTLSGKKLVGSAQRRLRHSFVQHGSMPLDTDFFEVVSALKLVEQEKTHFREEMQSHARSLAGLTAWDWNDFADYAEDAFTEALGEPMERSQPSQEEAEAIAAELAFNPHGLPETWLMESAKA